MGLNNFLSVESEKKEKSPFFAITSGF